VALHNGTKKEIATQIIRLYNLFKNDRGYILAYGQLLSNEKPIEKAVTGIDGLSQLNR
jgi:hypothetical protein